MKSLSLKKFIFFYFLVICLPVFILTFIAPIYYDDISFAGTRFNNIGWQSFSLRSFLSIVRNMYNVNGRVGHGFIHFFIHFRLFYALMLAIVVPIFFSIIPFLLIHKRFPYKVCDLMYTFFYFSIFALLSFLFPNWFYLFSDWANKTVGLTYFVNTSIYFIFTSLAWMKLIEDEQYPILDNWISFSIFFSVGFFASIHNEFITIYGNGIIFGVIVFALILKKHSIHSIANNKFIIGFSLGNIIGTILILTSKGFLNAVFNPSNFRTPTTLSDIIQLLIQEVFPIVGILLALLFIVGLIVFLSTKDKENLIKKLMPLSIFFLCLFLGFITICLITRVPYLKVVIIASGVVPLVYLLLCWATPLLKIALEHKIYRYMLLLICLIPIMSSYYVTLYNFQSIYSINIYFQEKISRLKLGEEFQLTRYNISFKRHFNIFSKNLRTSEMYTHGFSGSDSEAIDYGLRVMFHIPDARKPQGWHTSVFINFSSVGALKVIGDIESSPIEIPRKSWFDIWTYYLKI